MTIRANYLSTVSVVETFTGPFVSAGDATASFSLNSSETLTAASDVPVTKHAEFSQALTAGAATINLAALPGVTAEETVVGTGLKVQLAKFLNPDTNANDIVITFGASNPYLLLGTGWKITLKPGQENTSYLDETAPDVGASTRTIDISGTAAQVLSCIFVLG